MNFFNKYKNTIYISLFATLYGVVAFSSLWHAISFFGLANNTWMAIVLAAAFEIGQAATLFALLTSSKDRNKIMPWVLMTMFTLVQILGNVYSSYKHIISNSVENLRYFKEPVFIWTNLPDDQVTVIITYLVGGVLPLAALMLTSMVTNYLEDNSNNHDNINKDEQNVRPQNQEDIKNEEPSKLEEENKQGSRVDGGNDIQDVKDEELNKENENINKENLIPKKSHLIR